MRAFFYIDGFNFYYLRTKHQPEFKWLNMKAMADEIVPDGTTVEKVNYYTARVSGKIDTDAPRRQSSLIAAMRTVPEIEIHFGRFLYQTQWAGLAKPLRAKPDNYVWNEPAPEVVEIKKAEEKGSDVNLGVHMVRDAFIDAYDIAYVLTNDTDLVEPLRIVKEEIGKKICLIAPNRPGRHVKNNSPIPAETLKKWCDSVHYLDDRELAASQFPQNINRTGKKPVSRPASWIKR